MELKWLLVTQSGSVNDFYSLIQANPNILQTFDVVPFIHTPLHEASSTGKIDLAMKVMILKPSFAKKLNEYGFSPLHLAVENHQVELALELVKFDLSLVRIRGRGGMTPLHLVAKKDDVELLTEFLHACPESIKDANVNGETALHITVMNDRYEELKVLTGWMQRMRKSDDALTETHVLNSRDRQGNPALHQAAYKNNHKVVKQLLKCMSLYRNIQNKSGMTALDVLRANGAHMNIDTEKLLQKAGGKSKDFLSEVETKSVYLRKQVTFWECCSTRMERYRNRMSDGARNALLVITALIITATYQTAVNQEEEKHKINAEKTISKIVLLWGFNTIALTFILIPPGTAYTWWYIFITLPLVCSYALSVYMKYDLTGTPLPTSFINLYMLVLFGFLVYLLVFYVRWKRNRQKKVPKPKDELIFKTMV